MTARRVAFSRRARADLRGLYLYVAERSGARRADPYVQRVEARCRRLGDFPERGTRRDDLRPRLRTVGFERRALIAYAVVGDTVAILRVLYGGRDLAAAFSREG